VEKTPGVMAKTDMLYNSM